MREEEFGVVLVISSSFLFQCERSGQLIGIPTAETQAQKARKQAAEKCAQL